jgi:hypothetical protein
MITDPIPSARTMCSGAACSRTPLISICVDYSELDTQASIADALRLGSVDQGHSEVF